MTCGQEIGRVIQDYSPEQGGHGYDQVGHVQPSKHLGENKINFQQMSRLAVVVHNNNFNEIRNKKNDVHLQQFLTSPSLVQPNKQQKQTNKQSKQKRKQKVK